MGTFRGKEFDGGCKDSRFIELSARFEAFRGIGLAKKSSVEGRKASHPKTFVSETLFSILAPMADDGWRAWRDNREMLVGTIR